VSYGLAIAAWPHALANNATALACNNRSRDLIKQSNSVMQINPIRAVGWDGGKSEWQPLRATVQCECSMWRRVGAESERSKRSKGGERGRTHRLKMGHALNGDSSSKRNDKYVQQRVTHGKGCSDATLRPIDGRFSFAVEC
jgi:hypothetical protein